MSKLGELFWLIGGLMMIWIGIREIYQPKKLEVTLNVNPEIIDNTDTTIHAKVIEMTPEEREELFEEIDIYLKNREDKSK